MAKERIGILGGTFDPIHTGHLHMAGAALAQASLDRILVIPSADPPYKKCQASPADRWRMTVAACAQENGLEPCDLELRREGPTYTADTLAALREAYPKAEFTFILGADAMMALHKWDRLEEIARACSFLVLPRASRWQPAEINAERKRLAASGVRISSLDTNTLPVSSSELRESLERDELTPLLQVPVREYIEAMGLYGRERRVERAAEWIPRLFDALTPKRFAHSLSVAHTARRLARVHGEDELRAETAGLLHDCAKCFPLRDMQEICRNHRLTDDEEVLRSGALMHSLAGAVVARETYGEEDPAVLDAIAAHTTGREGMTRLDMIVYLADKIEPTRPSYPLLEQVRMTAQLSLERAMLMSMEGTIQYVQRSGKKPHGATQAAAAWLRGQIH